MGHFMMFKLCKVMCVAHHCVSSVFHSITYDFHEDQNIIIEIALIILFLKRNEKTSAHYFVHGKHSLLLLLSVDGKRCVQSLCLYHRIAANIKHGIYGKAVSIIFAHQKNDRGHTEDWSFYSGAFLSSFIAEKYDHRQFLRSTN